MSVTYVEGVPIKDPTAVWMQLLTTRRKVLDRRDRWNSGSWIEKVGGADVSMCLSNALRFVAYGKKTEPKEFAEHGVPDSERLVMKAISKRYPECDFDNIPAFNDYEGRTYGQVLEVIEDAIAMVAPFAREMVVADEVMTDEERAEIREQVFDAEAEMFKQWRLEFKTWLDSHERRGWSTFWEELYECEDGDEDCKQRLAVLTS